MLAYAFNLSTWEVEVEEEQLKVILGYIVWSRPDWAIWDLVAQKNQSKGAEGGDSVDKGCYPKAEDMGSVPRTYVVERKNQLWQVVL